MLSEGSRMFTLYDHQNSTACQRVRLVLAEKNAEWDARPIDLNGDQYSAEYLKINPNACVPALQHQGHTFVEATVISHYIDDVLPSPALMPSTPLLRARLRTITKLVDEQVHLACRMVRLGLSGDPSSLGRLRESSKGNRIAADRLEMQEKAMAEGIDGATFGTSLGHIRGFVQRLERHLSKSPFLAGQEVSLADTAAFPYVFRMSQLNIEPLFDSLSAVPTWIERIKDRPAFSAAFGEASVQALPTHSPEVNARFRHILATVN